jgi:hypothetical protein
MLPSGNDLMPFYGVTITFLGCASLKNFHNHLLDQECIDYDLDLVEQALNEECPECAQVDYKLD